ncbi:MAG: PH domain-containing protein [Bifidobacteriaceae bacterium]|jgi:membrane protein YdbS with pleckstrin-like domain|nr:PH domain-containing protein [Bifidobacteriaceae bacterium]
MSGQIPQDVLFDPKAADWRGVNLKLISVRLIVIGLWFGLPVLGGLIVFLIFRHWWIAVPIAVWALLGLWTVALNGRRVRAIGYLERTDDLLIRKGVVFRELKVIPYGRLQYLDVTAGPLDRAFGLAKLDLKTAAGALYADLPGLDPAEAARLRDRLSELGNARMAGL